MGFNNRGAQALADRLATAGAARGNLAVGIPIGISIGKTKNVALADATEDYLVSLRTLVAICGLRRGERLQPEYARPALPARCRALAELIRALVSEAWRLAAGRPPVPIFVKVAPDLTESALDDVVSVCSDAGAEGMIATNTTLSRDGLLADQSHVAEAGGLSGTPLTRRAREVVRFPRCSHVAADHRGGRHHEPRRRPGDAGRGRQPAADLHRLRLRRPSTCRRSEPPGTGSRAAVLRRREATCFSSPSDDEVGGFQARSARSEPWRVEQSIWAN